jgi:hypothetical protein
MSQGAGRPGFESRQGRHVSLRCVTLTSLGVHTASLQFRPGSLFPEIKQLGLTTQPKVIIKKFRISGGKPPLPQTPS